MESMKRVAENLVTNAVRHGRENGIIDIEMAYGKVTISNTTDGDLPDDIDSLWEPYVKGRGSRTFVEIIIKFSYIIQKFSIFFSKLL